LLLIVGVYFRMLSTLLGGALDGKHSKASW
jgi:hypothetical protein